MKLLQLIDVQTNFSEIKLQKKETIFSCCFLEKILSAKKSVAKNFNVSKRKKSKIQATIY